MGWYVGWRERLPGGFWVGWRHNLRHSRRHQAGCGCGGLIVLLACLLCALTLIPAYEAGRLSLPKDVYPTAVVTFVAPLPDSTAP